MILFGGGNILYTLPPRRRQPREGPCCHNLWPGSLVLFNPAGPLSKCGECHLYKIKIRCMKDNRKGMEKEYSTDNISRNVQGGQRLDPTPTDRGRLPILKSIKKDAPGSQMERDSADSRTMTPDSSTTRFIQIPKLLSVEWIHRTVFPLVTWLQKRPYLSDSRGGSLISPFALLPSIPACFQCPLESENECLSGARGRSNESVSMVAEESLYTEVED
jgi:hypothetical protein